MTIEEFNSLIKQVERTHNINESEIATRLKYNAGYIAQIRSRKKIPEKFINSLRLMFFPENNSQQNESPVLQEPTAIYQTMGTQDNYLLSIIKTQAETILSQQTTIQTLITQPTRKTA